MLYAMLLALFLPLGLMFSHFEQRQQDLEQGALQSMLFYVDQLRVALPAYRVKNSPVEKGEKGNLRLRLDLWKESDVKFNQLSFPLKLAERSEVKQYVDGKGFYIVWKQPPRGLAHVLVKHYSRASSEAAHLIFYHIGFTDEKGCLVPSRHYQQPDLSKVSCAWPLPKKITEGALVLTDREPTL